MTNKGSTIFGGQFLNLFAYHRFLILTVVILWKTVSLSFAQIDSESTANKLKKLSMEELMNIEVTTVSKQREKLSEVASAIQVLTNEDIRRSGATSVPEALRLASNLAVAQLNSYAWIIGARGFNAVFSNKLQVMIDGRIVYSPLFAGVFWDVQNVVLEDIERIEIISGPGGTLWGANAVNGVINIITKKSQDSQGLFISGATGTYLKDLLEARYGGKIGSKFSYRIYGQHFDRSNTLLNDSTRHTDKWGLTIGGLRIDYTPTTNDEIAIFGNAYWGKEKTVPSSSTLDGQNIMARWAHTFSERSNFILQLYYDRTWREDIPSTLSDELQTYDLDFQHQLGLGERHNVIWGAGFRQMMNNTINSTDFVGFVPKKRNMQLFSAFIQDEINLIQNHLKFTVGSKLQHNVFTGFEVQPSGRITWTPKVNQTIWGAISRAVRMPSRIDVDYRLPTYDVPLTQAHVYGGPHFVSEKLIAYELGYRSQPTSKLSFSLAAYYNNYDDLYTVEAVPGTLRYQIQNGMKGYSVGTELSGTVQLSDGWRVRGGYTFLYKELKSKPGHTSDPSLIGNDPKHVVLVQSMLNLPGNFQLDIIPRYYAQRPKPEIPEYFSFDARIAWLYKQFELSITGQNLFEEKHKEYQNLIERNIYGRISCRF
jgi:iron complex outermembrane recepter protein